MNTVLNLILQEAVRKKHDPMQFLTCMRPCRA